ncbi:MAG: sugar transferase [Rhodospirillales bacterium]|nr:sugar transferase [Rhodospirillales bacterium]
MKLESARRVVSGAARPPQAPPFRRRYKRPFDLAVLGLLFLALWPLWLILVAAIVAAVRLQDGGPALYRQRRLGLGGQAFDMLKFRTMPVGAERRTGPVWAGRRDRRATPVGRVLRRLHLDELPQAVNVARGEMSLVGPRPERPAIAARIERRYPGFAARLSVPPGIAGLAQARGRFPAPPREKLRYDRVYIGAMGPWLDLKLLAACVWRTLRGRPARAAARQSVRPRSARRKAPPGPGPPPPQPARPR